MPMAIISVIARISAAGLGVNLYVRAAVWRFDHVDREGKVIRPSRGNEPAESAPRWLADLGVPRSKLLTTGNIKLDVQIPRLNVAEQTQLRRELGLPEGLILLGASTWPGEEAAACVQGGVEVIGRHVFRAPRPRGNPHPGRQRWPAAGR